MAWSAPSGHTFANGENVSPSTLNTYVLSNPAFLYGDVAWTAPTFINSWVNFGAPANNVGFRLIGTRVYLRGLMKSGTLSLPAFILPVGYRPLAQCNIVTVNNSLFGAIQIAGSGAVTPYVGSTADCSLENISFDTI